MNNVKCDHIGYQNLYVLFIKSRVRVFDISIGNNNIYYGKYKTLDDLPIIDNNEILTLVDRILDTIYPYSMDNYGNDRLYSLFKEDNLQTQTLQEYVCNLSLFAVSGHYFFQGQSTSSVIIMILTAQDPVYRLEVVLKFLEDEKRLQKENGEQELGKLELFVVPDIVVPIIQVEYVHQYTRLLKPFVSGWVRLSSNVIRTLIKTKIQNGSFLVVVHNKLEENTPNNAILVNIENIENAINESGSSLIVTSNRIVTGKWMVGYISQNYLLILKKILIKKK